MENYRLHKVTDFGANIHFTITFTQERVHFESYPNDPLRNEKLSIKEMLNSK